MDEQLFVILDRYGHKILEKNVQDGHLRAATFSHGLILIPKNKKIEIKIKWRFKVPNYKKKYFHLK